LNAEQSITPNHIAGADIKEMQSKSFAEVYSTDFLANWAAIRSLRKPVIAA
jgi:enoyl-CoA hydratase/carnithine racemase